MHLADVIALRATPAAGLIIECTRRCPLSCAHCATSSTMAVEEHSGEPAITLVNSFTTECRPQLVALTGGEPLLRPAMVAQIATKAHKAGASMHLLTGMYFAVRGRMTSAVARALKDVDHVSASLDAFHEREVPRKDVFRVIGDLLGSGKDVSFQIVGADPSDPYIQSVVTEIRREFADQVPMLVSHLRPEGRARRWLGRGETSPLRPIDMSPCTMAAWPLVRDTGDIVACCNQVVADGAALPHLALGHASTDDWSQISQRCVRRSALRAIRCGGPRLVTDLLGTDAGPDYCGTCHSLSAEVDLEGRLSQSLNPGALAFLDNYVAGVQGKAGGVAFAQRLAMPEYAALVALGHG